MLAALSERILARFRKLDHVEMHDFLCGKRLLETEGLEAGFHAALLQELQRLLDTTVAREPDRWPGYCLRPIQVADRPDSPFFAALRDAEIGRASCRERV